MSDQMDKICKLAKETLPQAQEIAGNYSTAEWYGGSVRDALADILKITEEETD